MGLPLLALSSVLLLLAALLVFTTLIHLIGLSDSKSALGLPEGSVRALLALALLGLFAVMACRRLHTPRSERIVGGAAPLGGRSTILVTAARLAEASQRVVALCGGSGGL
jgi:hypothetical protein